MSRRLVVPMVLFLGAGALGVFTMLGEEPAHEPSSWYNRDDGATQRELVFIPEGKRSLSKQIEVGSAVCVLWRTKHPTDLTIASGLGGVRKLHPLSAEEVANGGTYVRGPFLRLEFGSKRDELAYVEVKAGPLLSPLCEELRTQNGWDAFPVKIYRETLTVPPRQRVKYTVPGGPNSRFRMCFALVGAERVRAERNPNVHGYYNPTNRPISFTIWAYTPITNYDCDRTGAYLQKHGKFVLPK